MNRHKLVFNNLFPFKHELLRKSRLENKSDFKLDSTKSDSDDLKKTIPFIHLEQLQVNFKNSNLVDRMVH